MFPNKIAKICDVNSAWIGKGIADDSEWRVYQLRTPKFEPGQYVECLVQYDEENDGFFLKPLEGDFVRTMDEWELQESKYRG